MKPAGRPRYLPWAGDGGGVWSLQHWQEVGQAEVERVYHSHLPDVQHVLNSLQRTQQLVTAM